MKLGQPRINGKTVRLIRFNDASHRMEPESYSVGCRYAPINREIRTAR